jgi:hypothetical protein
MVPFGFKCSNRENVPNTPPKLPFDLAHRNRIEWEEDKLNDFRLKLENRIKAVIA